VSVFEIVPSYTFRRRDHRLVAEVVMAEHTFLVHLTLPKFVVPESPHWNEGIRIGRVKCGRAIAAMMTALCQTGGRL
jgi:hypothetical protein